MNQAVPPDPLLLESPRLPSPGTFTVVLNIVPIWGAQRENHGFC